VRQYIVSPHAGNRRFSPSLLGTLLTAGAATLFVSLGSWQLDRAEEKRALMEQAERGGASVVETTAAGASALPRYQKVRIRGRYDSGRQILLDSMFSPQGRPGYRVLTPLVDAAGGWILVDRGWIAPGRTRAETPDVAVSEEPRTVIGWLDRVPQPGIRLSDATDAGSGWPRVLNFPPHEQLERAFGGQLAEAIVRLDPEQPDGYERPSAPLVGMEPRRHVAYAVQWFAFAALALIIYVVTGLRKTS
jgi:surfeit locus 1 family protein